MPIFNSRFWKAIRQTYVSSRPIWSIYTVSSRLPKT